MITPTVGRVILIRNRTEALRGAQPECGLVAYVHDDGKINIGGTNHHGLPFALTEVTIRQDDNEAPQGVYAEWMPYQKGQAAKAEKLESDLEAARRMASAGEPLINIDHAESA